MSSVNVLWSGCEVGGNSHHSTILQFAREEEVGSDVDSYGPVTLTILFDDGADVVCVVVDEAVKVLSLLFVGTSVSDTVSSQT